jgi:hypothetical protein
VADPTDTASRIALARDNLTAKLGELRRREARVRVFLSPLRYLANPWLRVGVAAVIGYQLGRASPARAAVERVPAGPDTLIRSLVRASLVAVAQAVVRRAGSRLAPSPAMTNARNATSAEPAST